MMGGNDRGFVEGIVGMVLAVPFLTVPLLADMLAAPVKRVDEIAEESWIRLGDGAGGSSFVFYPEGSVADMGEKYHVVVGYLNEGTQVVRTCSTQGVNKVEASANPDISRTQGVFATMKADAPLTGAEVVYALTVPRPTIVKHLNGVNSKADERVADAAKQGVAGEAADEAMTAGHTYTTEEMEPFEIRVTLVEVSK